MNSREKLDQRLHEAQTATPETEQEAMVAQLLAVAAPMVGPMIPEDPAELDDSLLRLTKWLLSMRSDDAELEAVVFIRRAATAEVLEGPADVIGGAEVSGAGGGPDWPGAPAEDREAAEAEAPAPEARP
jgi:hypothetical protein